MKTVVIYARTSADEAESGKIPSQIAQCQKHCESKGYTVLDILSDADISGRWFPPRWKKQAEDEKDILLAHFSGKKKLEYRQGFDKVLDYLPRIDAVICVDRTRIDRSLPDSVLLTLIRREFKKHSVVIEGVMSGTVDFNDRNSSKIDTLISSTTSEAKSDEKKKSKLAMLSKKDEGLIVGTPPYGYESCGRQQVRQVPSEIDNIKYVFKLYLSGMGTVQIADKMKAEKRVTIGHERKKTMTGVKPKHEIWSRCKVLRTIDQPNYAGLCYNTKGELILSKIFPEILDKEVWLKIHEQRVAIKSRFENRVANKPKQPLAGLMFCQCGYNLHWQGYDFKAPTDGRIIHYGKYQCDYGLKNADCRLSKIDADNILQFCKAIAPAFLQSQREAGEKMHDKIKAEVARLKQEQDKVSNKIKALLEMTGASSLLTTEISEVVKKLGEEKAAIQQQIAYQVAQDIMPAMPEEISVVKATTKQIRTAIEFGLKEEIGAKEYRAIFRRITTIQDHVIFQMIDGSEFKIKRISDGTKWNRRYLPMPKVGVVKGKPTIQIDYGINSGDYRIIYSNGEFVVVEEC